MKKELKSIKTIYTGYVLETRKHDTASELSYDNMSKVGYIRIAENIDNIHGDDLNDTPFDCNGSIYEGEEIELEKGDLVIIIKNNK